jgi:hypothetical protein
VVSLHCKRHVDVVVLANEILHPGAVGLGHLESSQGGSLHNEVVHRNLLGGVFVELGPEFEEIVDSHLDSDVVVRNILFAVAQSFRNHLPNLRVGQIYVS